MSSFVHISRLCRHLSPTLLLIILASSFLSINTLMVQYDANAESEETDDWAMFRHDAQHSGYSTSTAPNTNQTLWNYTTGGNVYSSPAVVDDKVYIGSEDNKVYCLNAADGASIWNYTTGFDVYSSPAVVDGRVYVGSYDHKVYCLNATTGALIWNYTTGNIIRSSPAVADGRVYISSNDNKSYCLDAATGTHIWSYDGNMSSSPAVADGKVYVSSSSGNVCCFGSGSSDWPMFHHDPQHSGYSTSTAPNTNSLLWTYPIASLQVWSSPAVAYGRVYIGSGGASLSDPNARGNVSCINADSGAFIWNYTTDSPIWFSSPAVADGKVYIGSDDGKLYCLGALSGESMWNFTTGGNVSSPAVAGGKVYVGSADSKVYCLDAATGTHIWNYTTGNQAHTPAIAYGKVYVGSNDTNIYALNSSTGALIWNYTTGGIVMSSPAAANGRVYVGSWDSKVYCLNATTGALIWNYTTGREVWSSPAVADGKVYIGSNDAKVYCLNASTGTFIWSCATGSGIGMSSPAVADGKVYIGSSDAYINCINATTGAYIWSYPTSGPVSSSPAVANGVVYVGSEYGQVYAFRSPSLKYFDNFFKHNNVRMIYPEQTSKPLGCVAAMVSDWLASGFIYTKLQTVVEGTDTDAAFVNQTTGKPLGATGTGIVSFGGPIVNLVVAYAENASTSTADRAPLKFYSNASAGSFYFQHQDGTSIPGANLPISVINNNMDIILVEVYLDSDGRNIMLCYGFGWKGTYAAGKYFLTEIYPNIANYSYSWIIVKWEDTNANGFVNITPDGDTYTVIATG